MARGHEVQLAAPVQFTDMAAVHKVPFVGLPGEFLALLDTPEGKAAVAGGDGFHAGFKLLKHVRPLMTRLLGEEWRAVRSFQPDVLVCHPKSFGSPDMAAALGVPHVLASPIPGFTPTGEFPSPMLPFASLGPFNRMSHTFAIKGARLLFAKELKAWRACLLPHFVLISVRQKTVDLPTGIGPDETTVFGERDFGAGETSEFSKQLRLELLLPAAGLPAEPVGHQPISPK